MFYLNESDNRAVDAPVRESRRRVISTLHQTQTNQTQQQTITQRPVEESTHVRPNRRITPRTSYGSFFASEAVNSVDSIDVSSAEPTTPNTTSFDADLQDLSEETRRLIQENEPTIYKTAEEILKITEEDVMENIYQLGKEHNLSVDQAYAMFCNVTGDPDSFLNKAIVNAKLELQPPEEVDKGARFTLRGYFSTDQKTFLVDEYPELNIQFQPARKHEHGVAAAARSMDTYLQKRKTDTLLPTIDVGGNPIAYISKGITNVHCCCPKIDYQDRQRMAKREEFAHQELRKIYGAVVMRRRRESRERGEYDMLPTASVKFTEREKQSFDLAKRTFDEFISTPEKFYCTNEAQLCSHIGLQGLSIHAAYDIPLEEWPIIMMQHKTQIVYGSMLFSTDMHVRQTGEFKEMNIRYDVDADGFIQFCFMDTMTPLYRHNYEEYMQYGHTKTITYGNYIFLYEVVKYRKYSIDFEISMISVDPVKPLVPNAIISNPDQGMVEVTSIEYDGCGRIDKFSSFNLVKMYVNRSAWDRLIGMCMSRGESLIFEDVMRYCASLHARIIINKVVISDGSTLNADNIVTLAIAAYAISIKNKYIGEDVYHKFKADMIDWRNEISSIWSLLNPLTFMSKYLKATIVRPWEYYIEGYFHNFKSRMIEGYIRDNTIPEFIEIFSYKVIDVADINVRDVVFTQTEMNRMYLDAEDMCRAYSSHEVVYRDKIEKSAGDVELTPEDLALIEARDYAIKMGDNDALREIDEIAYEYHRSKEYLERKNNRRVSVDSDDSQDTAPSAHDEDIDKVEAFIDRQSPQSVPNEAHSDSNPGRGEEDANEDDETDTRNGANNNVDERVASEEDGEGSDRQPVVEESVEDEAEEEVQHEEGVVDDEDVEDTLDGVNERENIDWAQDVAESEVDGQVQDIPKGDEEEDVAEAIEIEDHAARQDVVERSQQLSSERDSDRRNFKYGMANMNEREKILVDVLMGQGPSRSSVLPRLEELPFEYMGDSEVIQQMAEEAAINEYRALKPVRGNSYLSYNQPDLVDVTTERNYYREAIREYAIYNSSIDEKKRDVVAGHISKWVSWSERRTQNSLINTRKPIFNEFVISHHGQQYEPDILLFRYGKHVDTKNTYYNSHTLEKTIFDYMLGVNITDKPIEGDPYVYVSIGRKAVNDDTYMMILEDEELKLQSEVYLYVEKDMNVVLGTRISAVCDQYLSLRPSMIAVPIESIMMEMIAGAGKSFFIEWTAARGMLVLTQRKGGVPEMISAFTERGLKPTDVTVATIDSYVLNGTKTYGIVLIDEATMAHFGAHALVVQRAKPMLVVYFGDRSQIPFSARDNVSQLKYTLIPSFVQRFFSDLSRRFPADACALNAPIYNRMIYTDNQRLRSFSSVKITIPNVINEVPYVEGAHYICFTNPDVSLVKKTFKDRGCSTVKVETIQAIRRRLNDIEIYEKNIKTDTVTTAHVAEGGTWDHVIIVRPGTVVYATYSDLAHILVATTRHRISCTYYTAVPGDALDKRISKVNALSDIELKQFMVAKEPKGKISNTQGVKQINTFKNHPVTNKIAKYLKKDDFIARRQKSRLSQASSRDRARQT